MTEAKDLISKLPRHCKDFHNSDHWVRAYQLYNEANPRSPVKVGCSSCCKKVLSWLNRQR